MKNITEKLSHETGNESVNQCFVIMPISDPIGYEQGHFKHVYDGIFKPACNLAGFTAVRADDEKGTNLIHADILTKLLTAPIAICDLSSHNPNVLFEFGLRQAFDMPTVLVQEKDTPKIFDIGLLRYIDYRRSMKYEEVLEDQKQIADFLKQTVSNNMNSIVKFLCLKSPAELEKMDYASSIDLKLNYIIEMVENLGMMNADAIQKKELISSMIASLRVMHASGTPQKVLDRNINDIGNHILGIKDARLRSELSDEFESVKSEIKNSFLVCS